MGEGGREEVIKKKKKTNLVERVKPVMRDDNKSWHGSHTIDAN